MKAKTAITLLLSLTLLLSACSRSASKAPATTATPAPAPATSLPASPEAVATKSAGEPTQEPTRQPTIAPQPTVPPTPVPTASPEQPAGEASQPSPEPSPEPTAAPSSESLTHTVQPGENLYRIGLQYNLGWQTLAEANNLADPNAVYAGQVLVIPSADTAAPVSPVIHVVRPGENLFRIGLSYGLTWDVIARANNLANPNAIYAGMELVIPTGGQ